MRYMMIEEKQTIIYYNFIILYYNIQFEDENNENIAFSVILFFIY